MSTDRTTPTTGTGGTRPVGAQAVLPVAYRKWQVETFDKMRRALEKIADQMTSEELAGNHDHEGSPDYETSHDEMIRLAREVLQ